MSHQKSSSIFFLTNGWFPTSPGGQERYVFELTYHLSLVRDSVSLWAFDIPFLESNISQLVKLKNIGPSDMSLWRRLWFVRKYFLEAKSEVIDAINLHFPLYSLLLFPHLPKNIPVTLTFHGPWALESQEEGESTIVVIFKRWIENWVYQRCDRFIVLSKAFGEILHEEYKVSWDKIYTIPGGVDTQRFQINLSRQEARAQLNWPQDRLILFAPRRLVHRMGIDQLLTALSQIKPSIGSVWLAIAGKGPLQSVLEQKAKDLGLQNNVQFLGFLPDSQLPIAYQAADITVIPSQSLEGFGLVLLESLACGTPVICTPVGGMPEVIAPFTPELITESIEAEAIAIKLSSLLADELSLPSRIDCREYAEANFNWSSIAQRVKKVLLLEK